MLISLSGAAGAGKSTIAKYLKENYGFTEISFAMALKDVVSAAFGWDRDLVEGITPESRDFRETKCEWWSNKLGRDVTPRMMLNEIGTNLFRENFDEDFWLHALSRRIESMKGDIVISDVRFPNEAKFVKNNGGTLFRVRNLNKIQVECRDSVMGSWMKCPYDWTIFNTGSLDHTHKQVDQIIKTI